MSPDGPLLQTVAFQKSSQGIEDLLVKIEEHQHYLETHKIKKDLTKKEMPLPIGKIIVLTFNTEMV